MSVQWLSWSAIESVSCARHFICCLVLVLPREAGSDKFTLGIKHQRKQIHIQSLALLGVETNEFADRGYIENTR